MKDKILNYLTSRRHVCSTSHLAQHCIFKEEYDEMYSRLNGKVWPGRHAVSRAYYQLKKLAKAGIIREVGKGLWAAHLKDILDRDQIIMAQS